MPVSAQLCGAITPTMTGTVELYLFVIAGQARVVLRLRRLLQPLVLRRLPHDGAAAPWPARGYTVLRVLGDPQLRSVSELTHSLLSHPLTHSITQSVSQSVSRTALPSLGRHVQHSAGHAQHATASLQTAVHITSYRPGSLQRYCLPHSGSSV